MGAHVWLHKHLKLQRTTSEWWINEPIQLGIGVHFDWMKWETTRKQNDVNTLDSMHKKAFAAVLENFAHRFGHWNLFCCAVAWIICSMGVIITVSSSTNVSWCGCCEKWHQIWQRKSFGWQWGKTILFISNQQKNELLKIQYKQTTRGWKWMLFWDMQFIYLAMAINISHFRFVNSN